MTCESCVRYEKIFHTQRNTHPKILYVFYEFFQIGMKRRLSISPGSYDAPIKSYTFCPAKNFWLKKKLSPRGSVPRPPDPSNSNGIGSNRPIYKTSKKKKDIHPPYSSGHERPSGSYRGGPPRKLALRILQSYNSYNISEEIPRIVGFVVTLSR